MLVSVFRIGFPCRYSDLLIVATRAGSKASTEIDLMVRANVKMATSKKQTEPAVAENESVESVEVSILFWTMSMPSHKDKAGSLEQ